MVGINVALAAFSLFALLTEAVGIDKGDVDGALGVGRDFRLSTVEKLGDVDNMKDYKSIRECCNHCAIYFPATQMVKFSKSRNNCKCLKSIPGKSPITYADASFSGVCEDIEVAEASGASRALGEARTWNIRTVWKLGRYKKMSVTANVSGECCGKCKEKFPTIPNQMFEFSAYGKGCYCYKTIVGRTPNTLVVPVHQIDVCDYSSPAPPSPTSVDCFDLDCLHQNGVDCFEYDTDYPGMDLNLGTATTTDRRENAAECQALCKTNAGCNYFTWSPTNMHCYLKTQKSTVNYEAGVISGSMKC